jgi:hypothetical protein
METPAQAKRKWDAMSIGSSMSVGIGGAGAITASGGGIGLGGGRPHLVQSIATASALQHQGHKELVKANPRFQHHHSRAAHNEKTRLFGNGDLMTAAAGAAGESSVAIGVWLDALSVSTSVVTARAEIILNDMTAFTNDCVQSHIDMHFRPSGTREVIVCSPQGDFVQVSVRLLRICC